jgi:hypothetical protein
MTHKWENKDDSLALSQGWNVFDTGSYLCIQKIDDPEAWGLSGPPMFESDDDALRFVVEEYIKGCPTAAKALTISTFRN